MTANAMIGDKELCLQAGMETLFIAIDCLRPGGHAGAGRHPCQIETPRRCLYGSDVAAAERQAQLKGAAAHVGAEALRALAFEI